MSQPTQDEGSRPHIDANKPGSEGATPGSIRIPQVHAEAPISIHTPDDDDGDEPGTNNPGSEGATPGD